MRTDMRTESDAAAQMANAHASVGAGLNFRRRHCTQVRARGALTAGRVILSGLASDQQWSLRKIVHHCGIMAVSHTPCVERFACVNNYTCKKNDATMSGCRSDALNCNKTTHFRLDAAVGHYMFSFAGTTCNWAHGASDSRADVLWTSSNTHKCKAR